MGFLDSLFRRREPPPSRPKVTVAFTPAELTIESRYESPPQVKRIAWESVSGACRSPHQMKGIDICTLAPPYIAWLPDDAEGADELLAELERRELLGSHEEATAAWKSALTGILDGAIAEVFDDDARSEVQRLLEPLRGEPRMALALVELSRGSLDSLRKDLPLSETDGRDLIYAAWYAAER